MSKQRKKSAVMTKVMAVLGSSRDAMIMELVPEAGVAALVVEVAALVEELAAQEEEVAALVVEVVVRHPLILTSQ
jgi:hypothetical protein